MSRKGRNSHTPAAPKTPKWREWLSTRSRQLVMCIKAVVTTMVMFVGFTSYEDAQMTGRVHNMLPDLFETLVMIAGVFVIWEGLKFIKRDLRNSKEGELPKQGLIMAVVGVLVILRLAVAIAQGSTPNDQTLYAAIGTALAIAAMVLLMRSVFRFASGSRATPVFGTSVSPTAQPARRSEPEQHDTDDLSGLGELREAFEQ